MNITIQPGPLRGSIQAIPSKSCAHRAMICAAFAQGETALHIRQDNEDIQATVRCLRALGVTVIREEGIYRIQAAAQPPRQAQLYCGESGSTLRFLLPVVGALGVDAVFHTQGRLAQRPLSPLWEEMIRMGCSLSRDDNGRIYCSGKLRGGEFRMAGNVSSQFLSGLLLAGPLLDEGVKLKITGTLESRPYVDMTRQMLSRFGAASDHMQILPGSRLRSPGAVAIEGDWSNAAFFLAANYMGSRIHIDGLDPDSCQGDRQILSCLDVLPNFPTLSAAQIPDLIPILSVAATRHGAVFTDIRRLRLKESDRVEAILAMIRSLGGKAEATDNALTVSPGELTGGTVESFHDHRIAMAAAIAATQCREPVTILDAEAVNKSYPGFWEDYQNLGGNYEQYLR